MIAYIYRAVCLGDSGHKIIQEAMLVLKNFQGKPAHGASNSAVGVFTGLHCLVSAHFQTNQEIEKLPPKSGDYTRSIFLHVSLLPAVTKDAAPVRSSQNWMGWCFSFQLSWCLCLEMVTTATFRCHVEFLHRSPAPGWEWGAIVCAFLRRAEDFSGDPTSSRCHVVFHLLDGFSHLIKTWRGFNIVTNCELSMELKKTLPLIKWFPPKTLKCSFHCVVTLSLLTEQFSGTLRVLTTLLELQDHQT